MKHTVDCLSCEGTGIGYGGPDSKCGACKGRGFSLVADEDPPEDDEPEQDGDYDESREPDFEPDYSGPCPGDGNYLE